MNPNNPLTRHSRLRGNDEILNLMGIRNKLDSHLRGNDAVLC
jgi:hypothetical protein